MACPPASSNTHSVGRRPTADTAPDASAQALGRVVIVARGAGATGTAAARARVVSDDLTAAVAERGGTVTDATSSVTDALRSAGAGGAADAVVVVFAGVDRYADEWAGPQLLARLRQRTTATVIAGVPEGDRDAARQAAEAGAHLAFTWPTTGERVDAFEPPSERLRRLEAAADLAPFLRWFRARYGADWLPWMADAAVAVALCAGNDRQSEWTFPRWQLADKRGATRRLRDFRRLLSGEVRDDAALERRAAIGVLRALGRVQAIDAVPAPARSLAHAADAVRRDPQVVDGLLRSTELRDLLEVDDTTRRLERLPATGPGRPPSGAWLTRRRQAIGQVVAERAPYAAGPAKSLLQEQLLSDLQATVAIVHDALDDAARVVG